mmetsp:Transcript_10345/g.16870  ORF Transcript_10345/g.16870 Transcript_10345/m.16870 type:complete len:86 (+) Transcript_10345:323-580(+)
MNILLSKQLVSSITHIHPSVDCCRSTGVCNVENHPPVCDGRLTFSPSQQAGYTGVEVSPFYHMDVWMYGCVLATAWFKSRSGRFS